MSVSTRNRGMILEQMVEQSCKTYQLKKEAKIFKRPVEKKLQRGTGKLIYAGKAGVDFNGTIMGGRSIAFDAKETTETNRFPLDNVHGSQYDELGELDHLGAYTFLIVGFMALGKFYLLPYELVHRHWTGITKQKRGRGSIPLATIVEEGIEIHSRNGCALDFIDAIKRAPVR